MNSIPLRTTFALLIYAAANAAVAGTLSITGAFTAAFENDGAFTPVNPFPSPWKFQNRPLIYQVDLALSVSNLTANERGLLNLGFNIELNNLTIAADYAPDSSTVDSNGAAPGGLVAKYFANGDGGPSSTDYQGIFATIANNLTSSSDPRVTLGQSSPSYLGSLFVLWDGQSHATIRIRDVAASFNLISGTPVSVPQSDGVIIPEPAALSLGALSLIGMMTASRRRS